MTAVSISAFANGNVADYINGYSSWGSDGPTTIAGDECSLRCEDIDTVGAIESNMKTTLEVKG